MGGWAALLDPTACASSGNRPPEAAPPRPAPPLTRAVLDAKGQPVNTLLVRHKRSDNLLMFLIKAKCPEYRDNYRLNVRYGGAAAPQDGGIGLGERLLLEDPV